jgi:AmiR/NasT family two-component response regulator
LVGRDEKLLENVRRELTELGAHVQAEFRNVETAAASLRASSEEMRLFIVALQPPADLDQMRRLGNTFIGRPILALTEQGTDAQTLFAFMRAGAMQIVPYPLDPVDFREALQWLAL